MEPKPNPDWTDDIGEPDMLFDPQPLKCYRLPPEQEEGWKRNCEDLNKRLRKEDDENQTKSRGG